MTNLFTRIKNPLSFFKRGLTDQSELNAFEGQEKSGLKPEHQLILSRPLSLEQRYSTLENSLLAEEYLRRLRDFLKTKVSQQASGGSRFAGQAKNEYLFESGRIGDSRFYFFMQPLNDAGFLFESSSIGWLVSRAQKNYATHAFLRSWEPWDQIILHYANDGSGNVRASSERFGLKLVSFSVYQQALLDSLQSIGQ